MTYTLSKLAMLLLLPSTLIMLMLLAGLALMSSTRATVLGRRLAWTAAALAVAAGLSPLANLMRLPLEERFPRPAPAELARTYSAIIVLGGGEDGHVSAGRGQLALNTAGERIVEGARLALRLTSARLVFAGGAGTLGPSEPAAEVIVAYWRDMGIAPERILYEQRSRNTHENAIEARKLLAPEPGERFLLVTSAYHMPRAIGVFRRQGLDVVAYPVDYRIRDRGDLVRPFRDLPSGMRRLDETVREWVGLFGYRLLGRTEALIPSP